MSTASQISRDDANGESQGGWHRVRRASLIAGTLIGLITLFWVLHRSHLLSYQLFLGFFFASVGAGFAVLFFRLVVFLFRPHRIEYLFEIEDITEIKDTTDFRPPSDKT
jgi:hypothetical protein